MIQSNAQQILARYILLQIHKVTETNLLKPIQILLPF